MVSRQTTRGDGLSGSQEKKNKSKTEVTASVHFNLLCVLIWVPGVQRIMSKRASLIAHSLCTHTQERVSGMREKLSEKDIYIYIGLLVLVSPEVIVTCQ